MCAVCVLLCAVPVFSAAAQTVTPTGTMYLNFNSTDWTGDTAQIDSDTSRLYAKYGTSSNKVEITYKDTINLSASDFSVSTYLRPIYYTSNRYGEYCALKIGQLELREYNKTVEGLAVYTLRVFYNGAERASYDLGGTPNHYYAAVKVGSLLRVKIDNKYITLTDENGSAVDGISAEGMDFSDSAVSIVLYSNWNNQRYAEGCIINPNYADRTTEDVTYPDSSLYIKDSDDENSTISYMNTAVTIPQGTDNGLVTCNYDGIYFESDIWQAVPMISQELIDLGYIEGGEACQAVASLVTSTDGTLSMFGTDCGGLWRSLDGGTHWQLATIGLDSAGATGIAIDPKNKNHVIVVGCNTGKAMSNGIFVTTDAANQCEWTKTLSASKIAGTSVAIATHNDYRVQIVYDASSYDSTLGYCKTAYWSVEDVVIKYNSTEYKQAAMWKTTDGGFTWQKLENAVGTIYVDGIARTDSAFLAGAEMDSVTVGNTTYIYAATSEGFYISTDGGAHWTETMSGLGVYANSIDTVNNNVAGYDSAYDGYVWASTDTALYRSADYGYTWSKVNGAYYPAKTSNCTPDNVFVSSLNPLNIYITHRGTNGAGWYSNDGGQSWNISSQYKSEAWQPVSGVSPFGYWSNIYEDTLYVMANGVWKSIDAGVNLHWSNSGYNAILVGGKWNFNVNNPNLVSVSSQDFNGGFSTDGGKTWTYLSWRGASWGGFTYGAYMLNEKTLIACDANSWTGTRYLWVTHDGGETYENTEIVVNGTTTAIGCIGHDSIAFMGEWRTDDYGYTWREMTYDATTGSMGCDGVYTVDKQTGILFGRKGTKIVYSANNGVTWHQIGSSSKPASDMAYDHETGTLYVVDNNTLTSCHIDFNDSNNSFETISYSGSTTYASSCAVDPNNPNVVYVSDDPGITAPSYENSGVYRSLDRGKTWTCITRKKGDGRDLCPAGGKAAISIRVNPATGELFAATSCKGMWKIAAPAQWYLDENTEASTLVPNVPDTNMYKVSSDAVYDIIDAGRYTNPTGYEYKTVELELISASAGVENGYFKVPDGVKIYTGDHIKLGCHYSTAFVFPNGASVSGGCMNTTTVKGSWAYSKQVCKGHNGYYSFDEPGDYTIYTINSGNSNGAGWAIVTFTVEDPYSGVQYISTEQELAEIGNNLSGNYVLENDIELTSDWTSIGTEDAPFCGLIYGNGHTVSGLTDAFIGVNNGSISHLEVIGTVSGDNSGIVADKNLSYIGHVKAGGTVSGKGSGAITGYNAGIIEQSLASAEVSGTGSGGIAGYNHTVTDETSGEVTYVGSIKNTYYSSAYTAIGTGAVSSEDTAVSYTSLTDSAQFGALDDSWYVVSGAEPQVMTKYGYSEDTLIQPVKSYTIINNYLYLDTLSKTVADFTALYSLDGAEVSVYGADDTVKSGDQLVNTGDVMRLECYGTVAEITFVITGDVTMTRCISSAGAVVIKGILVETINAGETVRMAADMNHDKTVTSGDYLIYKQALLGLVKLY